MRRFPNHPANFVLHTYATPTGAATMCQLNAPSLWARLCPQSYTVSIAEIPYFPNVFIYFLATPGRLCLRLPIMTVALNTVRQPVDDYTWLQCDSHLEQAARCSASSHRHPFKLHACRSTRVATAISLLRKKARASGSARPSTYPAGRGTNTLSNSSPLTEMRTATEQEYIIWKVGANERSVAAPCRRSERTSRIVADAIADAERRSDATALPQDRED